MPGAWQVAFVLTVFFGMAGFLWLMRRHFERRFGVPPSRFPWICGGIAAFGIVFVIAATLVMRAGDPPVIFRARLEGTAGLREGEAAVVRTARFAVSHPGRKHLVSVRAVPGRGVVPTGPIRLRLSLVGPGETALVETDLVLPVRSGLSWRSIGPRWEPGTVPFRPPVAGRYVVRLIPLNPGIGRLDLRVIEAGGE
jgi:hypothetical protein